MGISDFRLLTLLKAGRRDSTSLKRRRVNYLSHGLLQRLDDDGAVGGGLFADDLGDLIFKRGLGLGEDVCFFDGFAGILEQGVDGFLALLFGDFIPEAIFVLEDFDVGLLDGMDAGGWESDADGLAVFGGIDDDGLIQIEAGFGGEAAFDV